MYHRVREAKYRTEIVTFVWDFSEHINSGDSIVDTPITEILVSSGTDNDPSEMILGPAVVTNGMIVSQRIRKGIPGTIYTVTITVHTVQDETFEDLAYLAILPLPNLYFTFFLETMLYPIEMYYESLETSLHLLSGKILDTIPIGPDGIVSDITLVSGTLFGAPIYYTMTVLDTGPNGNEALQSFITLISGTLIGGGITYTMRTEGITASIHLIDGTLFGNPLNYDMTTEGINSYITLIDGTLT
jgi:hypothetical protein